MKPWLSQDEIDDLCEPLTQAAAQVRALESLGLTVNVKPGNGRPIVLRSNVEAVLGPGWSENGARAAAGPAAAPSEQTLRQPDAAGLVMAFRQHKK